MRKSSSVTRRTAIRVALAGAAAAATGAARAPRQDAKSMERVEGIGGFFFRAKDPKTLAEWYESNLGITGVPRDYNTTPWRQSAGTTAFAPFKEDTTYFGDRRLQWMINFRVRDIDKMISQLQDRGISVKLDPQVYPNGRFARLADPEGNPIELWQPKDPG
jgi:predicted enzyme related to lactoylglutathione lyase